MAKDAVKVPGIIARAAISTQLVLYVKLGMLAVLFRLVMLLAIFDESSATVVGAPLAIMRDFLLARRVRLSFMQLLHESMMSLRAVLALGVCLRALLRARGRVPGVARLFLASSGRFVLLVVLPVPHQSIPLRE